MCFPERATPHGWFRYSAEIDIELPLAEVYYVVELVPDTDQDGES
jgi:hypothetical protein